MALRSAFRVLDQPSLRCSSPYRQPVISSALIQTGWKGPRLSQLVSDEALSSWSSGSLTALVRGAGPTGLASAIELRRLGFQVLVVDHRLQSCRKNFVAGRQYVLDRFSQLGVRPSLLGQPVHQVVRENPWDPHFTPPPPHLDHQLIFRIGNAEAALFGESLRQGVHFCGGCAAEIVPSQDGLSFRAILRDVHQPLAHSITTVSPDLIVWASGKSNQEVQQQLGIDFCLGFAPEEISLPQCDELVQPTPTTLETNHILVFGLRPRSANSTRPVAQNRCHIRLERFRHSGREEPLQCGEIQMIDEHGFDIQLPRGSVHAATFKEQAILKVLGGRLNKRFARFGQLLEDYELTYGSLEDAVVVENSIAQKMWVKNVILVGDAGGGSGPAGGRGLATGLKDSEAVAKLGKSIAESKHPQRYRHAMEAYHRQKVSNVIEWCMASRSTFQSVEWYPASLPWQVEIENDLHNDGSNDCSNNFADELTFDIEKRV